MTSTGPIHVLHVIGQLGVGGCEMQLLETCRRMDRSRFRHSVCWYADSEDSLEERFREAGVKTYFVNKFDRSLVDFVRGLRSIIKRAAPDVVHTWLRSANFWGRCAAVSCGQFHLVASDRNIRRGAHWTERLAEQVLAPTTLRLANSASVAASIERQLAIPSDSVSVLYNAVEVPRVSRSAARAAVLGELSVDPDERLVVMVARQHPQKNYPMFIRVARRVCRVRDGVTFVGIGRGDMMHELRALAEDLGPRLHLLGLRTDVAAWLAAADAFAFTTDYEGFPNALLEAIASAVPAVTTRFAGVDELLRLGVSADVVGLDDDVTMARMILRLLDAPSKARRRAEVGREAITRRFGWPRLLDELADVYSGVATGAPRHR